jgi:hypothetical protein
MMESQSSDKRSRTTGESERSAGLQYHCGSILPAIRSRDTESMTCERLKIACRVGPETDFEEDGTTN